MLWSARRKTTDFRITWNWRGSVPFSDIQLRLYFQRSARAHLRVRKFKAKNRGKLNKNQNTLKDQDKQWRNISARNRSTNSRNVFTFCKRKASLNLPRRWKRQCNLLTSILPTKKRWIISRGTMSTVRLTVVVAC